MKLFALAVICAVVAAASAGWVGHGGAHLVPASAHGGAVGGHIGAAAAIVPASAGGVALPGWGGWGGWGHAGLGLGGWGLGGWGGWGGWHGGWAGAGHDGQWIPDHSEAHYDDGSYRPEHHYAAGHHW